MVAGTLTREKPVKEPDAHCTVENAVFVAVTTHVCAYVLVATMNEIPKPLYFWFSS